MGLVIKAALGALVVLLIGVLAKTKNYYIAGLIPLFPTFALIAHYIVASERGIEALRATIIFSMWSIIPYFGNDQTGSDDDFAPRSHHFHHQTGH